MDRPDLRLFLGKGGSGKTTLALHQARGAPRVLIHDPNGEAALGRGAIVTADRRQLLELVARPGPVRVAWRGAMMKGRRDAVATFEWANRCALAAGDLLVLWDEIDRFDEGGRLPQFADIIVNSGRHRRLRVFCCARSPYQVPRDVTRNATRIAAFRIEEPRDLAYLGERIGAGARELPTLRPRHALDWSEQGGAIRKSPFT